MRVLILAGTWLPVLAFVAYSVPRFAPIFDRLAKRHELPQSTQFLLSLIQLGPNGTMLAGVVILLVILALDRATARSKLSTRLWWIWFAAVFAMPIVLLAFCHYALIAPIYQLDAALTP